MRSFFTAILSGILLAMPLCMRGADENFVFPNHAKVRVQYQAKRPDTKSWTTYTTTLNDVRTESMIRNQLMQRHPGYTMRVLAASAEKDVQASVRYQIRNGSSSSWTSGTTVLRNALTESMAENQIASRYPDSEVRILSMVFK